jgi:MFS family permease
MTTAEMAAVGLSDVEHGAQLRRAVVASTVGTVIEAYDFLLYGQVAGLVFAKLYFPGSDPLVGTLQAFAIYAVGFVARPVGAALFGHWGDRIGRKATLIATLLLTGLSTFAVGFVPGYVVTTIFLPDQQRHLRRARLWCGGRAGRRNLKIGAGLAAAGVRYHIPTIVLLL